jgi:3-hydroxybutyrate dehydrogenase
MCHASIRISQVEKQISDTAETRGVPEDEVVRDVILHAQPTKRFVTFQELNGLLLFLCSEAGASVNGAALPIDGGWTAR